MKKVAIVVFVLLVFAGLTFTLLRPNLAIKTYKKGLALADSAQYELAIEKYSKAIWLKDKIANFYYARGLAYAALENEESAIIDFNKAIELNPGVLDYFIDRGISYRKKIGRAHV